MKLNIAATALLALSAPSCQAFAPTNINIKNGNVISQAKATTFVPQNNAKVVERRKQWGLQMSTLDEKVNAQASIGISPEEILKAISPDDVNTSLAGELISEKALETRKIAKSFLSQYKDQTGASTIYTKLQEHDVTLVSGYSGGANLPLLDEFHEDHPRHSRDGAPPPIRWITNSNENSSGHVMEGYAKASHARNGEVTAGVVIATSGPGVTNLITPLQDAMCDGVPMVVMCGQAATFAPPDAFQSADAIGLTKPCTKWNYKIKSAAELPFVMDYAFFIATNGRPGPVFIDLPKDLLIQKITEDLIEEYVDELPIIDSNWDMAKVEDGNLVKLLTSFSTRVKTFSSSDAVIRMGNDAQGLEFQLNKVNGDPVRISAVENPIDDNFHLDHHPSNTIIAKSRNKMGNLNTSSPLMNEVVSLIHNAKRPIIIAGQGCNDSVEELKLFAETLQIPVTTTLHGLGCFDERHPLALNMIGMHGHPTPNFMIQEADLVICIGSRFDDRITGKSDEFIPEARKASQEERGGVIHVDIRLTENGKQVHADYFVHSTGKNFLNQMTAALVKKNSASPFANHEAWLERKAQLESEYPIGIPQFPPQTIDVDNEGVMSSITKTPMSAQSVIKKMNSLLVSHDKINDCTFSTGVGIHQMVAAQLLTWTQPRQMISSGSLGTMGVALGFAIGAKLADDSKICIAIDGDGSFNMTFTELKTLAEQGIAVKIIILDNESQMMVEYWQRLFQESRFLAVRNTHNPDYTTLASSFGIKNLYADCEEDLEEKMREFLFEDQDKPVLFHVKIERTPCLPLVAPGSALDKMILVDEDFEVDKSAAPS
jgi:acetolactate synthase-1/2/3 large subunit